MPRVECRGFALCVAVPLLFLGCGDSGNDGGGAPTDANAKPTVCAVNYPLTFFARRIAGGTLNVQFPIPAGVDPAFWQPTAEDIGKFQSADLILLNGANYAKWISTATLPGSKLVTTTASVADRFIRIEESVLHQHGPQGKHSHADIAFTTWLDPDIAIAQAAAARAVFAKTWPRRQDTFDENFAELKRAIEELDEQFADAFNRRPDVPIVFSHPVYHYLARRYQLKSKSVHWEPEAMPDEGQWRELEQLLKSHAAKVMIWEAQPLPATADRLRRLGIESIVFDPCGNAPQSGDYLTVMAENLDRLRRYFGA